ncbi:MAG TPA: CPBP family glutamic-type intramembrane protease [Pyrinomonadaceae bacterium]|nr:CPBP family glutamic-type intramembrane protease [Pyrinomonadaceae bacterium]
MLKIYESIRLDFANLDKITVFALVYAAFALTCIYYLNNIKTVSDILRNTPLNWFGEAISNTERNNLTQLGYWIGLLTVFYFIIPTIFIKFIFGKNLTDFGLKIQIEEGFWQVLLLCFAIMLPLIFLASLTSSFATKYPFFKIFNDMPYLGYSLLIWEILYIFHFFCTEFFFRGFLIQSLKPTLGMYSIFVMTIPYCMIHYGKPGAEAFAAILAGIFLGWLSYTNNSIWLGLSLHCVVALTMDFLALYQKKQLF